MSERGANRGQVGGGGGDALLAALEAAPTPIVLVDPNQPDDPIVLANTAFLRMTGYDRPEVVGRNCRFLQGPESDPDAVARIRAATRARGEVAAELLNYRKDGTPFWNALSIAPVFDAAGGLIYLVASQRDVSRRRAAEQASALPMGAAVAGRATGDVAHDLNNMLQVIAGHAEGLRDHAAASGDARLIRRTRAVSEAAARAVALARLLDGPRPDAAPVRDLVGAPAAAAAVGGKDAADGPDRAVPAGGARVLVVDDRAEVAELARTMLEGAGYRVEVATDGRDALEKLGGNFDLLFSDVVMPGGPDGVTLAREARRRFPGLRILLTTGRAGSVTGRADAGFETIGKPYRRSELVGTVRRLLDGPPGGG